LSLPAPKTGLPEPTAAKLRIPVIVIAQSGMVII
jgi:hypothetical protein